MDVFWLEANPWDYATSQAVTVRACSADLSLVAMYGSAEWLPVLDGGPTTSTTVFNGAFTGAADTTRGSLNLTADDGSIDLWARYAWAARPLRVWRGELDLSDPITPKVVNREQIIDGLSETFDPDEATLFLTALMPNGLVAAKVYTGAGGVEGPSSLANAKRAVSFGYHRNRAPQLLDVGKQLYRCNAAGRLEQLIGIRERGRLLDQTFKPQTTFQALSDATIPATEIHYHLETGCFRLGFTPAGDITADFRGAPTGAAYPNTVMTLIYALLIEAGWPAAKIDTTNLNAIDGALPHEARFHDDTGTDIADALTSIMQGCGGYWDVDLLGTFYCGIFQTAGTADFSIGDEGLGDYDVLGTDYLPTRAPFWRNRVGFDFNPSVMSFSDTEAGATPDQLLLIQRAIDTADGKIDVFYQSTTPTGTDGDLWYNTDTRYWYRYVAGMGPGWTLTQDAGIGLAITAAGGAQATADGKITSYSTEGQPANPAMGDLWTRPSEVPRVVRRWNGSIWDPVSTIGADINANVYDTAGGAPTLIPRTDIKTSIGTAAAITGQAPAATDATIQTGATRDVVVDTRSINSPPSYYRATAFNKRFNMEFKELAAVGAGFGAGTYGTLETIAPWQDGSGGPVTQRITDQAGTRYIRYSVDLASWSAWQPEYSGNRKPYFGSDLLEQAGGAFATLTNFKTILGNAAGFSGQTAWATFGRSTLTLSRIQEDGAARIGTGSLLLSEGGDYWITNANAVTALGSAASIFGQGPGATATADRVLNNTVDSNVLRIGAPVGGAFGSQADTITGVLRIQLPQSWTNTMMTFDVEIYNYIDAAVGRYTIGGYNYAPATRWFSTSASYVGADSFRLTVRFGYENGRCCIYIGEPSTVWRYPQIRVLNFRAGYGGNDEASWASGWNLNIVSTAAQAVNSEIVPHAGEAKFGLNLLEQTGIAATLANFKTLLGTAAGFSGQTAWATFSTPTGVVQKLRSDGALALGVGAGLATEGFGEWVTNSSAITRFGTAAGFTGQTSWATLNVTTARINYLTDEGRMKLGNGNGLVNEGNNRWLTDGYVITEYGQAATIYAQGYGATAPRANVDNAYVPLGVNTQIDSAFARKGGTWKNAGGNIADIVLAFNRPDYSGKRSVAYFYSPGTPPAGQYSDVTGLGIWGFGGVDRMRQYGLPVKVGDVLGGRALVATHRCTASLYLLLYNANGDLYSAPVTTAGAAPGGGAGGDSFGEMSLGFVVSDPNMAYAQLMIRMTATGENNPYIFFSEPWIGKLASASAPIPPYSPGPADPTSDRTLDNTAGGFTGQAGLATRNYVNLGYQGVGGVARSGDVGFHTEATLETIQGTSAAFTGQGGLSTLNQVTLNTTTIRRADGSTIVSETLVITQLGQAASFYGQGRGATSNNLSELDPSAAAKLANAGNGDATVPYGQFAYRLLDAGASIPLTGYVFKEQGGSNGSIYAQIQGGPSGAAQNVIATGQGSSAGPTEPGGDYVQATFTNNTGVKQQFTFRVVATGNGGGQIRQSQSYLEAGY